ncbi:MAG: mevalonate kinase [Microgenomates group bacterium]
MMTISAPGKLMLMGEHAVVYGYPCLVTAVSERLAVSIEETQDNKITIDAPQVKDTRFVDQAIFDGCRAFGITHHGLHIKTHSNFSNCYGFGSSSAVTVATLEALATTFHKNIDKKNLFEQAYKTVLTIQGVGSGFDVAAATHGGTLLYTKGGDTLQQLSWDMNDDVSLVVGYSGIKADTPSIVKDIAKKKDAQPELVNRIFEAIGKLVLQAKVAGDKKDWETVGKLMNFNQEYLRDLGVSTEKLESMIYAAKQAGAFGAKLSGAGGGDCMIALVSKEKKEAVEKAIAQIGTVVSVSVNTEGVRVDTTDDQSEQFIVVDTDDTVIRYASRYVCHHDKSLMHRTVGVLIYNKQGKLLLQKRSHTKDMEPGKWGISSAGHVTKGQTNEEAMHRELLEELGVDMPIIFFKKFIVEGTNETEMACLYTAKSEGPFIISKDEVEEVDFFDTRELKFKVASGAMILTEGALISLRQAGVLV